MSTTHAESTPASPEPAWLPYIQAWNDPSKRKLISRGDVPGFEYLADGAGLGGNILTFWLAAYQAGPVPADLHAAAWDVMNHQTALKEVPITSSDGRGAVVVAAEKLGQPMVVRGPDEEMYFLTIYPFRYAPVPNPSNSEKFHPGPARRGEIAVVPVPKPPVRVSSRWRVTDEDDAAAAPSGPGTRVPSQT